MCGRRDDSLLIDDMIDAAERILDLGAGIPEGRLGDDQSIGESILWNILILGEATKRMRPETRARFDGVDWTQMAGTRDRVTHHYEGIDWEIVTLIIANELPVLLPRLIDIRDIVRTEFDALE